MSAQLPLLRGPRRGERVGLGREAMRSAAREVADLTEAGARFLYGYALAHQRPFNAEEARVVAELVGLTLPERRGWGAAYRVAQRRGYIRRAAATYRRSNGVIAQCWELDA